MPIPDPDKIWPKLENTGLDEVKKRLLIGAYAKYKIPVVEEWMRLKENESSGSRETEQIVQTKTKPPQEETLFDSLIRKIKNHPIISIFLILGLSVIALSNITDALDKLIQRLPSRGHYIKSENLPGETGWILVGDIDLKDRIYIRGPLFEIVKSNYKEKDIIPRKGEFIKITSDRNVVVADYKTDGLSKIYQPPWQENILDDDDYTGFKVKKGSIAEVRDVSLGAFPNHPAVLWVRIGVPPN